MHSLLLRLIAASVLCVILVGTGHAIPITLSVTVPDRTPPDDPIYVAGSWSGFDPADPAGRLQKIGPHEYRITLQAEPGGLLAFHFTRGSAMSTETGPHGEPIGHRRLRVNEARSYELHVASWKDIDSLHTIRGDVRTFTLYEFLEGRRVWIYLPSGYEQDTGQRYPVLYMLDGQNLFDAATSFAGEWEVDESCERAIRAQEVTPLIVVAIDNGGAQRVEEYTPWTDHQHRGGGGQRHLQQIVETLKPYVDRTWRTLPGPEYTAFAGSSLGGLMALHAALAHGDTFGQIAAFSPSLWWAGGQVLRELESAPRLKSRIYADMGTLERSELRDDDRNGVDDFIDDLRALHGVLRGKGLSEPGDLLVIEDEGGRHHESAWARRFPVALRWMFPGQGPAARPDPPESPKP